MQELWLFKITENLHTFILRQTCWWAKEYPPAHFPYNMIENSPNSSAYNSVFVGTSYLNLVKRHVVWSYGPYRNLDQTDHNLHNHAFDDVISKSTILSSVYEVLGVQYSACHFPNAVFNTVPGKVLFKFQNPECKKKFH